VYHYTPRQVRELTVREYNMLMQFAENVAAEQNGA
jgi:hypothetical protein